MKNERPEVRASGHPGKTFKDAFLNSISRAKSPASITFLESLRQGHRPGPSGPGSTFHPWGDHGTITDRN